MNGVGVSRFWKLPLSEPPAGVDIALCVGPPDGVGSEGGCGGGQDLTRIGSGTGAGGPCNSGGAVFTHGGVRAVGSAGGTAGEVPPGGRAGGSFFGTGVAGVEAPAGVRDGGGRDGASLTRLAGVAVPPGGVGVTGP